jgi:HK97 family phage major capsid protein
MNTAELQRDLTAKKTEIESLITSQVASATSDKRDRTPEEIAAVDAKLAEGKAIRTRLDAAIRTEGMSAEVERLTAGLASIPAAQAAIVAPSSIKSMGRQFAEHPEFRKFVKEGGHRRSGSWVSPTIDLHATTIDSTPGSGGQLVLPQVIPGIVPLGMRLPMISDLLAQGTVESNALIFLREKAFTNAAAPVAEGAAKPESALVFEQATVPVTKIAHWLPVTEEMLEDVPALASYIDARLRRGLDLVEDDQLLNGDGVPPDLLGILATPGLAPALPRGTDTNMDAILKQITTIATTAFVQPTGIVLNPVNWQAIAIAKNAQGNYMGAGPWAAPQPPMLWGIPVAVTPAIVAGTGLVGDFQGSAQEFTRGAVRVELSNSHVDFFVKNLIAIRAEERIALAVYRPGAFGTVTGLN